MIRQPESSACTKNSAHTNTFSTQFTDWYVLSKDEASRKRNPIHSRQGTRLPNRNRGRIGSLSELPGVKLLSSIRIPRNCRIIPVVKLVLSLIISPLFNIIYTVLLFHNRHAIACLSRI